MGSVQPDFGLFWIRCFGCSRLSRFNPTDWTRSACLIICSDLPPPSHHLGFENRAPILVLPNVFEPDLCGFLIDQFERHGGRSSGFMQESNERTVEAYDPSWKRRRDYLISDTALTDQICTRVSRRIAPMMQKAFQFGATRIERHLVACYSAEDGGHFGPHRDDTVKATEHRQFAVSINLNSDFEGGLISFPEFGEYQYKAPAGAAVVFSSALLHRVSKVTLGRRYAFLPFLHNEESERRRQNNLQSQVSDP